MEYTNEEIERKLEELSYQLNLKKIKKTELTKDINSIKKQIQYWKKID